MEVEMTEEELIKRCKSLGIDELLFYEWTDPISGKEYYRALDRNYENQKIIKMRLINDEFHIEEERTMTRKQEFKAVKKIIKERFGYADCGIYRTRNIAGDQMDNIFKGKFFSVDICYGYMYYEVFGTTDKEWQELRQYYNKLRRGGE